jgi:hypothetical protein
MSGIFVSYRRDDSSGYATLLYDQLASRYGEQNVFMDVDSLEPGKDYGASIHDRVDTCDVMVAVIGPRWLTTADTAGGRRLDDPEDWVRAEVSSALARDVRVIPVLVDGAAMPGARELPEPLAGLARREALALSNRHVRQDMRRLNEAIDDELNARGRGSPWHELRGRLGARGLAIAAAAVAVLLVVGAGTVVRSGADELPGLRQFAASVDGILEQAKPSRTEISALVVDLRDGTAPTKDHRLRFSHVITNRQTLVRVARRLEPPTDLARAAKADLVASFRASLAVDRKLEACIDRSSRDARAACIAGTSSQAATDAKTDFVNSYNTILEQLGRGEASTNF